ncbi:MAG: hypothetical protein KDK23_15985 [Leptospiraceae bacterium]|nr:hypothetical protein [Leptospiraceae bacterium]
MGENEPDPVEVARHLPAILWKAGKKWLGDRWDAVKGWFSKRFSEGKELLRRIV